MTGSAAVAFLCLSAHAGRPTDGAGLYAFDDADDVDWVDGPSGLVRVHYSRSGPNETRLSDDDGDGAPDFPAMVASTAEDVVLFFGEYGFRPPLRESDLGLPPLGGSDAFDVYLVDFAGGADGQFAVDACSGAVCSGHMVMENDFVGYGYPSLAEAVDVLTSHELFHAVQSAYNADQPVWMSEGTAVWAEWLYQPGVRDFLYFSNAYLEDTGRSIDRPPAGVATAFSYGTALFFAFLDEHVGPWAAVALQEEMDGRDADQALEAVAAVVEAGGMALPDAWSTFAEWNLAVGARAGEATSYSFADQLGEPTLEKSFEDRLVEDDNRFYPLAATYYQLTHGGGELGFATVDDATDVRFSLFPVRDGEADGVVGEPRVRWRPDGPGRVSLGNLPAGGYLLVGTYPHPASQSRRVAFCVGPIDALESCLPDDQPERGAVEGGSTGSEDERSAGCSTAGGDHPAVLLLLPGLFSLMRRRRLATRESLQAY
ncbi:MAG: MXAN_6640 family putative metalloprotease [Myxococcota bacterium]|nr:MXAN_6640 family putative metalloprotease [Myxococcota bacterium]MEC8425455.1 MXAN_6640 family putative metalloprotease [Myxococcota bacterium]